LKADALNVDTIIVFVYIVAMGGPSLEVFKFSLYLFVPVVALLHFQDPEWYRTHVVPVNTVFLLSLLFSSTDGMSNSIEKSSFPLSFGPGRYLFTDSVSSVDGFEQLAGYSYRPSWCTRRTSTYTRGENGEKDGKGECQRG
jgi:hypothetical protein